jgi:hypothetical protein
MVTIPPSVVDGRIALQRAHRETTVLSTTAPGL